MEQQSWKTWITKSLITFTLYTVVGTWVTFLFNDGANDRMVEEQMRRTKVESFDRLLLLYGRRLACSRKKLEVITDTTVSMDAKKFYEMAYRETLLDYNSLLFNSTQSAELYFNSPEIAHLRKKIERNYRDISKCIHRIEIGQLSLDEKLSYAASIEKNRCMTQVIHLNALRSAFMKRISEE